MNNQKGDNMELGIMILGSAAFLGLWWIFPQIFAIPMYGIRYAQSYIMSYIPLFGWDQSGKVMIEYLDQVDPLNKGYRDWIINMYESRLFYTWELLGGIICIAASLRFTRRNEKVIVSGRGVDLQSVIEKLAVHDFPHIRPFVHFNPLDMPEKEGLWRMPDTSIDFARNHQIMAFCSGCDLPVYSWSKGAKVACESQHDNRNLKQGNITRYCRVVQPESVQPFFNTEESQSIFFNQLTSMGRMPCETKDIPKTLFAASPFAYLLCSMFIGRLEEPGYVTQDNLDLAVSNLANCVRGYQANGNGVYDRDALKIAVKEASKFMTIDLIEKYCEPLDRHGWVITYIMGLLDYVRLEKGGLPTSLFTSMIGFERPLYYALNCVGSPSPHVEAWGCFFHFQSEIKLDRPIMDDEAGILSIEYTQIYQDQMGWNHDPTTLI